MLDKNSRLQPNAEEVAAKVIDGEAIIINLSDGTYYSMDGVGGFIWENLEAERSLDDVALALTSRYDVSQERAWADLERLAQELLRENLVTLSKDGTQRAVDQALPDRQRLPYSAPALNIYRDMAHLLALDPPAVGFQEIAWKDPSEPTG